MKKTAIFLFAESSDLEAKKKQFSHVSSYLISKRVSIALTEHTLKLVSKCERDFYWIDSSKQYGNSFGEKITNAFVDIFSMGYEHVICVGNDTLQLNQKHLSTAIEAVEHQKIILGPSCDGGTYLIGFSRKDFNDTSFKNIRWQSSKTYKNLKDIFCNSEIVETELLEDFDHYSVLKKLPKSSILSLVKAIIFIFKINFTTYVIQYDETFVYNYKALRAPPELS